jgi:DNA-binding NarL/FixJ family response regulator
MRIVIYTSDSNQSNKLTKELMESFSDAARMEPYSSKNELEWRLGSFPDIFVLILYLHDKDSLNQLLALKNLIAAVKTLIILPDSDDETVSSAHQLRPNYIGYVDETALYQNIRAVIDRLILNQSS